MGFEDIEQLKRQEEGLWTAQFRFDRAWMDGVLAADFFEYGRSGRIYTRDECLDVPGGVIDAVLPLPDFKVHVLASDVVHATYRSILTRGRDVERSNRSSIWVRKAGGWKLAFHQGTPVRD
jgi:hypothetical protein